MLISSHDAKLAETATWVHGTEPETAGVVRRRPRRVSRRRVVGVSAATGVLFAVSLVTLAPLALGSGLGIVLTHPYSGTVNAGVDPPSVGPGSCTGSENLVLDPPNFALETGRGEANLYSSAVPCTSWVSEFAGVTGYFGMNTSSFTPAASAAKDHIKVSWSVAYTVNLDLMDNTTVNGSAYAYANVQLDAWLVDVTTSTTTSAQTIYHNSSSLFDTNAAVALTVSPKTIVELIVADLTAGDTYVIETVLTCQTGVLVDGSVGTASGIGPSASGTAQLTFEKDSGTAVLKSISY